MYPAFKVEILPVASPLLSSACLISAHAAMIELNTIRPNEKSVRPVTEPPNHSTSPYAIRMIVKFLKMV